MTIKDAKTAINNKSKKIKQASKNPGIGWEIGAYSVRGLSVAIPAAVIMTLENSWVKSGLGLLAVVLIIALLIIFKDPIKRASSYAPGVIPFAIFVVISIFFDTTAQALFTVGMSGLSGCVAATPLHLVYLSKNKQTKSPELQALENIAKKL